MDFDPAAFGLPSGFGAQPKSRPEVDLSSTKRVEEVVDSASNGAAASSSSKVKAGEEEDIGPALDDGPEAGPSDLSRGARAAQQHRINDSNAKDGNDEEDEEDKDDPEDSADDADGDDDPTKYFPMSHEVILKDHTKAVTALAVDPPGARIITGGYDYDVKMWDFGGMRGDFRPFKSFEPYENYHVSFSWSFLATGTGHSLLLHLPGLFFCLFELLPLDTRPRLG